MARRDYDESDVRIRPSRRTKPRTKDRPSHDDAVIAFVAAVGVAVSVLNARFTWCRASGHVEGHSLYTADQ